MEKNWEDTSATDSSENRGCPLW